MSEHFSQDLLSHALSILAAEDDTASLVPALTAALDRVILAEERGSLIGRIEGQPLATLSAYGSLSLFVPPSLAPGVCRRLASFDRRGRLLSLVTWTPEGKLVRFKVRGLDGRFLGVVRGVASHLGWGLSDCVSVLEGEGGFSLDRSLTMFRSVSYEDLDFLPPLDAPALLPAGSGSTVLNVLALLAQDQGKTTLRYRGPYPSERLFATLCESFRYSGEPGVIRERFTRDSEEAAVQLKMEEVLVDWQPSPHERFFPSAHTCVQLRDGIEKVYDRGRVYYRADVAASANTVRLQQEQDGQFRYVAGLTILGQSLEDHLVLDPRGEILARPSLMRNWFLRGPLLLSDEWKAVLVRLIAAESTPLLQPTLWPTIDELTLTWSELQGELYIEAGNELFLHGKMITAYREALARVRSAGERLLLAARFASELARLIGPVVRARAQTRLTGLSPEDQEIALLFTTATPAGLPDNELRAFLTRLALGEELPEVAVDK